MSINLSTNLLRFLINNRKMVGYDIPSGNFNSGVSPSLSDFGGNLKLYNETMDTVLKNLYSLNSRANQLGKEFYQHMKKKAKTDNQIYDLLRMNNCNYHAGAAKGVVNLVSLQGQDGSSNLITNVDTIKRQFPGVVTNVKNVQRSDKKVTKKTITVRDKITNNELIRESELQNENESKPSYKTPANGRLHNFNSDDRETLQTNNEVNDTEDDSEEKIPQLKTTNPSHADTSNEMTSQPKVETTKYMNYEKQQQTNDTNLNYVDTSSDSNETISQPMVRNLQTTNEINLDYNDMLILTDDNEWLNDNHIRAASFLLRKKYGSYIEGLQDPILGENRFFQACKGAFVQILHDRSRKHWVTVSNLFCNFDEVDVYDSFFSKGIPLDVQMQVASIIMSEGVKMKLKLKGCQKQKGKADCGLFAVAFATSLCDGVDPATVTYDQSKMRDHFQNCLMSEDMTTFSQEQNKETRLNYMIEVTV